MNMKRSYAVTRKIFQGLRHDRRTLGLALFAPILAMLVFGTAFSGDVHDLRVIVVNADEGLVLDVAMMQQYGINVSGIELLDPEGSNLVTQVDATHIRIDISSAIISELEEGDVVRVDKSNSRGSAIKAVEDGEAWAMLAFPPDFTKDVIGKALGVQIPTIIMERMGLDFGNDTAVELRSDQSNVNVAAAIVKELGEAIERIMDEAGADMPLEVDNSHPVYGENAEFIDFFVPGIMALAIYLLTTMLTLLSFVSEKTSGTLERLQASPLTEGELVVGYSMAFGILGMVQAALLMLVATVVFSITIVGNPLLAFLVVALLAVVSQNFGILLSSLARNETQAVQMLPVIILPVFLLAGIFWPVEAIPGWLQPVSHVIPPTYAVEALRSVMLRGWGLERIVWPDLVALILFAGLFLMASVGLLKRRKQ